MVHPRFLFTLSLLGILFLCPAGSVTSFSLTEADDIHEEGSEELFDGDLTYDAEEADLEGSIDDYGATQEAEPETFEESDEWWDEYSDDEDHADFFAGNPVEGKHRDAVDRLLKWLDTNGAEGVSAGSSKIEVVAIQGGSANASDVDGSPEGDETGGGERGSGGAALGERPQFGIRAGEDITEGAKLLSIPASLWVSEFHHANEVMPYEGAANTVVLAAWLLRERAKGEASFWAPYIALLPHRVPLPSFWSDAELHDLDYQPLVSQVDEVLEAWESQYRKSNPAALAGASKEAFDWAMAVVTSRCIMLDLPQGLSLSQPDGTPAKKACFLLPLVDFLNHGYDHLVRLEASPEAISVLARGDVPEAAALRMSYSHEDNARLLVNYGFVPLYNPYDRVVLFDDLQQLAGYYVAVYGQQGASESQGEEEWDEADEETGPGKLQTTVLGKQTGAAPGFNEAKAAEVGRKAVEVLEEQLAASEDAGDKDGPEYVTAMGMGFAVWGEAHVEPRLLAALAAMCHARDPAPDVQEMDYERLANVSIALGRNRDGFTCGDADKMGPTAVSTALQCAAKVAVDFIREGLRAFRTSLEEDLEILGDSLDPETDMFLSMEEEVRVEFRISKKRLLVDAVERLEQVCLWGSEEGEGAGAGERIEEDVEEEGEPVSPEFPENEYE